MDYLAIIVSFIALVGAGFAFLRASSSHRILIKRIETLKEKNNAHEARLRKLEGNSGRGNKPASEPNEPGRRNQPRQEQQQEPRQKQPRQEQQQEQRQKQRERPQQTQQVSPSSPEIQDVPQQAQPRKKKENRRRNEPMDRTNSLEQGEERPIKAAKSIKLEIAEGDFLDNLERSAGDTPPG